MRRGPIPALERIVVRVASARWTGPVVVALAALAAYLPAVVVPYAFSDDYRHFGSVHGAGGSVWEREAEGGRPIQGAQLAGVLSLIPDLDSLRLVRLFGLLGAVLLGLLLYFVLSTRGINRWLATGISVSVITLPSFQVYVSWSVLWAAPLAAILGGLASLRLSSVSDRWSREALRPSVEAAALLLCGVLIYQPAAMFFWVFTAIEVLRPSVRLDRATRALVTRLAVAIVAMAGGGLAARVGVHFYGGVYAGRTELVRDVVGKVGWFWDQPLVNAFNLFELVPTQTLAIAIAIVAAVGIVLLHLDKGWEALGFLALAAALVPLSYAPNLVVSENFASYRSLGGLSALVMLYAWFGVWGIARAVPRLRGRSFPNPAAVRGVFLALALLLSFVCVALIVVPLSNLPGSAAHAGASLDALSGWPRLVVLIVLFVGVCGLGVWAAGSTANGVALAAGGVAMAAFALTGVLLAARNVTTLFVKPQSLELQMMRSALDTPSPIRRVVFVKPFVAEGAAPLVRYDEFGVPSSYLPWVPAPAVQLILREQRRQRSQPVIDVLPWDAPNIPRTAKPGEVLLDMRKVRQRRVGWSLWALHGADS